MYEDVVTPESIGAVSLPFTISLLDLMQYILLNDSVAAAGRCSNERDVELVCFTD